VLLKKDPQPPVVLLNVLVEAFENAPEGIGEHA
jgi:hypothetical protein